ncbi:hypothetical protein D3C76_1763690 [compost metagenome]
MTAVPACTWPILTTAESLTPMLRETTVCRALIMPANAGIGSMLRSGIAPCPPRPVSVMQTRSDEAMTAPLLMIACPTGNPGML